MNWFTNIISNLFAKLSKQGKPEWVDAPAKPAAPSFTNRVKASSFADPADVRRFRACKAAGKSDQECFRVGDNGIGTPSLGILRENGTRRGVDTTLDRPMCALPPEDWKPLGNAAPGALVRVSANGRTVVCELRDTMPRKANIKNGAGIDLNPAAVRALGLTPPIMISATWEWA